MERSLRDSTAAVLQSSIVPVANSDVRTPEETQSRVQDCPPGIICRLSSISAPDLARIEAESNRPPWSEKLFANEFSNPCSITYGVRSAGELQGFLVSHVVIDEAHIVNFAIAAVSRRKGMGRSLFSYVLRDLHARGVRWVTLEVRESNQVARRLYESLGFQDVGVRRGYYPDNQEDGIVMSLNILHFVESQGESTNPAGTAEGAVGR